MVDKYLVKFIGFFFLLKGCGKCLAIVLCSFIGGNFPEIVCSSADQYHGLFRDRIPISSCVLVVVIL